MSLSVSFHRVALAEFLEAAARYESQRTNLGAEFIAEIERCLLLAAEHSQLYAVVHSKTRRVTARRFPYSVYFRAEAARIAARSVLTRLVRHAKEIGTDPNEELLAVCPVGYEGHACRGKRNKMTTIDALPSC